MYRKEKSSYYDLKWRIVSARVKNGTANLKNSFNGVIMNNFSYRNNEIQSNPVIKTSVYATPSL